MEPICEYPCSMPSLPLEILEYILTMLPFHRDLPNARLVCRNWCNAATTVMNRNRTKFLNCLDNGPLMWSHMDSRLTTPHGEIVSPRYMHASCYYDGMMYIFGGTTPDTTYFNDVIKFDLARNKWSRLTSKNACGPLPKAGATMVAHNNQLIIYGGQSRIIQGIQQEAPRYHKELHVFDLINEDWDQIVRDNTPPRAAHQASVVSNKMVITCGSNSLHRICNDVWYLDLLRFEWTLVNTGEVKPVKRAYHSQAVLNEDQVIVMGGYAERNEPLVDVWLLTLTNEREGVWSSLKVENLESAPPRVLGQGACQVEKKMIALGKVTRPAKPPKPRQKCPCCIRQQLQQSPPISASWRTNPEAPHVNAPLRLRPNQRNARNRLRNEVLDFHRERFRTPIGNLLLRGNPQLSLSQPGDDRKCTCPIHIDEKYQNIHMLDLSSAASEHCVSWQMIRTVQGQSASSNLSFYSNVSCIDRIAVFGGISTLPQEEPLVSITPMTNQLSFLSFREFSPQKK